MLSLHSWTVTATKLCLIRKIRKINLGSYQKLFIWWTIIIEEQLCYSAWFVINSNLLKNFFTFSMHLQKVKSLKIRKFIHLYFFNVHGYILLLKYMNYILHYSLAVLLKRTQKKSFRAEVNKIINSFCIVCILYQKEQTKIWQHVKLAISIFVSKH